MRPRLIAAENLLCGQLGKIFIIASMRPRLIAAENKEARARAEREERASMRPRLIAAENACRTREPTAIIFLLQ